MTHDINIDPMWAFIMGSIVGGGLILIIGLAFYWMVTAPTTNKLKKIKPSDQDKVIIEKSR